MIGIKIKRKKDDIKIYGNPNLNLKGNYEMKNFFEAKFDPYQLNFWLKKKIMAGDVVFKGSIGRTDLPKGNYQDLIDSINDHLLILDDTYLVHCGHGPDTSIGHERKTNPFLNA